MGIKISNIKRVINKNGKIICPRDTCISENILKDNFKIPECEDKGETIIYRLYCNECKLYFEVEVIKDSEDDKRFSRLLSEISYRSDTM
ncbi:hypothetical protein SR42_14900 [Clostridium botulinum]|uniref:hypothetical protein n=1 Tax=Clostridium botulinum TaxID=1491 RepID=UPI000597162C|nr:hypothetical protein [Clostridium botulinum]KIL07458.1 hypothetical protein SR42_14900 [Clostridium botulinum]MBY6934513.1 hypothetical protein [Clostridium botulinum]NFL83307.1 hypothetical protein [Clostridium botulinum]NFN13090.1 hypothetical protein [Clostridium botulinum]NFO38317.1 hypothetical protein [Clostridium botulinum]